MPKNIYSLCINEERRGILNPEKTKFLKQVARRYPNQIKQHSPEEETKRPAWLEKISRKNAIVIKQQVLKARVPLVDTLKNIGSLCYSIDGDTIVLGSRTGVIQVRNAANGNLISTVRGAMEDKCPIMCVRYHPKSKFFAVDACGSVFVCSEESGDYKLFVKEKRNEINTCCLNLTGSILATAGKDAAVRLYNTETGKMINKYAAPEGEDLTDNTISPYHKMRVFAIKFHQFDENVFVSGGWDDLLKIWDVRVREGNVRNIRGPHICGDAIDIRDNIILTGSWTVDKSLQIWDLTRASLIDTIIPYNRPQTIDGEFLYCVRYLETDTIGDIVVVGGSGIDAVEVISIQERKVMCYFRVNKSVQAIDTYKSQIAFGGLESILRICEYSGREKVERLQNESLFQVL